MLERARRMRVTTPCALGNVEALLEMDAEETEFADHSFDIAVAMFVASVVPNPRRLYAELRRVVRPRRPYPVRQPLPWRPAGCG